MVLRYRREQPSAARTARVTARDSSSTASRARGATAAILGLQRTAGNQAVGAVLVRQPVTPLPPKAERGVILLPDDRDLVRDETEAEILTAFTAFTDACQANLTAMKAAAKADAELAALMIDVATGFLAPAFATWVSGKLAAAAAKATAKVTETASKESVKLISTSDKLKAGFTAATKGISQGMKTKSTQLFGEAAEDVLLDQLKKEFQANAVTLVGQLRKMPDEQLLATWITYDPELANVTTYKGVINDILRHFHEVQGIGSTVRAGGAFWVSESVRAYRIDAYGKSDRLILLQEQISPYGTKKSFFAWVPPYLEGIAVEQNNKVHGATTKIDPKDIGGHFPDPTTGK